MFGKNKGRTTLQEELFKWVKKTIQAKKRHKKMRTPQLRFDSGMTWSVLIDLALQGPMAGRYYLTILLFAELGCVNIWPNNDWMSIERSPLFCFTITVLSSMVSSDHIESIHSLDLTMAQILKAVPLVHSKRERGKATLSWKQLYTTCPKRSMISLLVLPSQNIIVWIAMCLPLCKQLTFSPPVIHCLLMMKMNSFSKPFPKSVNESV